MNLITKIWYNIKLFFYSLIYGMKGAEDMSLRNTGDTNNISISVKKEVESNRVSQALLRGEVNQAVEELRYRTYLVAKEAKQYEYFAPTLAMKRDKQDTKFMKWDDSDGLELITIQSNDVLVETVYEMLKQVGGRGKRTEHRVNVKRDFVPRFRVEDFMRRIDVKKLDDKHVILDMYFSKYPDELEFKSKGFIREIEKIRDEKIKSDILDYEEVSFVTSHAYKLDDLVKFVFTNIRFREVSEFDGHYILRFKAGYEQTQIDLTQMYYSKTMDEKYKNKEAKDVNIASYEILEQKPKFVCEECGKEVVFDDEVFAALTPSEGRDITVEEFNNQDENVLEFYDMQISEQMFGKRMCSDCLRKYLENNNII